MDGKQIGETEVTLGKVEKAQRGQPAVLERGEDVPIWGRGERSTQWVRVQKQSVWLKELTGGWKHRLQEDSKCLRLSAVETADSEKLLSY